MTPSPNPSDRLTDEQLAANAQAGCLASFEHLVRKFQVRLLHFLTSRVGDRQLAEDVLQETFLQAHRSLHTFDVERRFGTWIFTIARNLAHRMVTRPDLICLDPKTQSDLAIEDRTTDTDPSLWTEVRNLTNTDEFTALWLKYVEAMSIADIAAVLQRTPSATKMLLSRTRARLRERLSGPETDDSQTSLSFNKRRLAA